MSSAEYPGAIWVPAHPSNFVLARRLPSEIEVIVPHCTDGQGDARRTGEMFATPKEKRDPPVGTSAHFIVGQDALIVQSVLIKDIARHAHDASARSIGIEHNARTPKERGPSDPGLPPSAVQLAASARLAAWLCLRCGLAPSRKTIRGHAEVDPKTTHTRCPTGCGFDLDAYASMVHQEYAQLQLG